MNTAVARSEWKRAHLAVALVREPWPTQHGAPQPDRVTKLADGGRRPTTSEQSASRPLTDLIRQLEPSREA